QQPAGAEVWGAEVLGASAWPDLSAPDHPAEVEAHGAADAFVTGGAAPSLHAAPPGLLLRDPFKDLHRSYEQSETFWKGQLAQVEGLAEAWNAKVPVAGYVGGVLAGSPTILA